MQWLREMLLEAGRERATSVLPRGETCDGDCRHVTARLAGSPRTDEREAILLRHSDVADEDVGLRTGEPRSLLRRRCRADLGASPLEELQSELPRVRLVVHEEHPHPRRSRVQRTGLDARRGPRNAGSPRGASRSRRLRGRDLAFGLHGAAVEFDDVTYDGQAEPESSG